MKITFILSLVLICFFPLFAKTPLQVQSENAQNILEKTMYRITHSWEMMKYHFSKGNKMLKDSAKKNAKEVIDKAKSEL